MKFTCPSVAALLLLSAPPLPAQGDDPPLVAVDEHLWVAFYDVPSRRFRAIRDAFVKREFDAVRDDLATSASHLEIEASRAQPPVATGLEDVAAGLRGIAARIDDPDVTISRLDGLFGRAHWLLAQHYLDMAGVARDANRNRNAGRYLWATTHHMERAVLWSNARVDRTMLASLADLRDLAVRLQDEALAARARQEKPIVRAEKVLRELGKSIDRPVLLPIGN